MALEEKLGISKKELNLLKYEAGTNLVLIINKLMVDKKIWPQKIEFIEQILPRDIDFNPRKIMREYFAGNYTTHGALMLFGYSSGYIIAGKFTQNESKKILSGLSGALICQAVAESMEYVYETGFKFSALHYREIAENFLPQTDAIYDAFRGGAVVLIFVLGYHSGKYLLNYAKIKNKNNTK